MNILFFSSSSGKLLAKNPVTFGGMSGTQSEQSIVVSGYKAVVVNNWFEDSHVYKICHGIRWLKDNGYLHVSGKISQGCPFLLG